MRAGLVNEARRAVGCASRRFAQTPTTPARFRVL